MDWQPLERELLDAEFRQLFRQMTGSGHPVMTDLMAGVAFAALPGFRSLEAPDDTHRGATGLDALRLKPE